jgi:hypothetical protein
MLLVYSGMPTGQAAQRKLQPLTTSIQNSKEGFLAEEGALSWGYTIFFTRSLIEVGMACFKRLWMAMLSCPVDAMYCDQL